MDISFEQRLQRMLWREEEGEARSVKDLRALSAEERVLEGECIHAAVFRGRAGTDAFDFSVTENMSKFREGDALLVGDGVDFEAAAPLVFDRYDGKEHVLRLRRDPFARSEPVELVAGANYCIDRRPLGLRGRLQDVVRAGFANDRIRQLLEGTLQPQRDEERGVRAREHMADRGLNAGQLDAAVAAIAAEDLALIQGPPGTGKTRLLAEVLVALCSRGCRIALSAFTHRAVDNVLLAVRKLDPDLPLVKLGNKNDEELRRANVRSANPRRGGLPRSSCVVGGTSFALAKLPGDEVFHFTVFDEAGQLPIPHAIAGMLLSRRWIFVGDHAQLPPVITSHHADREATQSVFELLQGHYGSHLLDETYRMNDAVCDVVGRSFYGGRLRSAVPDRRVPFVPGGALDEVLEPERAVVIARVDHLQPGMRSTEEATLVADLAYDLRARHGVPAEEIAVLAPFRAQVRAVRSAMQRKAVPDQGDIVVDTVERMQGQEREVVLISLAVGDADTLSHRASFFFSTNRLNVAISRARSKVVIVASRGAFDGLPMDPDSLRAASLFKQLFRDLPQVDLTSVYA